MSVQERTREIGLMKALGMSGGKIFGLFSMEAVLIGLLGSVIGVGGGVLTGVVANALLTGSGGPLGEIGGLSLYAVSPTAILSITALIMLIAFLAGTLPAARAAKKDPIEPCATSDPPIGWWVRSEDIGLRTREQCQTRGRYHDDEHPRRTARIQVRDQRAAPPERNSPMSNSPYGEPGPEEQRTPNWGPGASGQQPNPHQQGGHQQGGVPYPQGGVPQDPGARFGSAPYDPFTAGAPLQKPARQSLLEKLTLISMALYLVGTVAYSMVFASDEIAVLFSDLYAEMGVPQEEIDFILEGLGAFAVVAGIFGSVITAGLYLLVYIPLVKGKSWARVLGWSSPSSVRPSPC